MLSCHLFARLDEPIRLQVLRAAPFVERMASGCKHLDELVNGPQVLPLRAGVFSARSSRKQRCSRISVSIGRWPSALVERVLDMMKVKLDEILNLVPVEKWRDFCTPFRNLLKSDFGDGQAKGLVPVLRNRVLIRILELGLISVLIERGEAIPCWARAPAQKPPQIP